MASPETTAAPLTFDQFWRWLQEHANCVVRAGTGDATLFDADALHWDFFEEEDGTAVVQVILGKALVGELVLEREQILMVQASPDVETPNSGQWLFELMGGGTKKDDRIPLGYFVLAHGMEAQGGHQMLKH